jgi:hypothetical protein
VKRWLQMDSSIALSWSWAELGLQRDRLSAQPQNTFLPLEGITAREHVVIITHKVWL